MNGIADGRGPQTRPVAGPGRSRDARRLVVLAVAALGLALLKPWALLEPGSAGPGVAILASRLPSPDLATPTSPLLARDGVSCETPDGWRLVTLERRGGGFVTTWIAASPAPATGPTDPSLPILAVTAQDLVGLGVCAPGPQGGLVQVVASWRLGGAGTTGAAPGSIVPATDLPAVPASNRAQLYLPADPAPEAAWPAGRYVLGVRWPLDSTAPLRYLVVDVAAPG